MYDIEELERQWQRYHRRRIFRRIGIGVGVFLVVAAPLAYMAYKSGSNAGTSTVNRKRAGLSAAPTPERAEKPNSPKQQEVLSPTVPSMNIQQPSRSGKEASGAREPFPEKPTDIEPKKPKMIIEFSEPTTAQNTEEASVKSKTEKRLRLEISDAKSARIVREIEARFPMSRDFDDAMYLAKYYYGKKRYRKAKKWAMQANAIDSGREESWIIFGKAMAKMGHRAEALKILQAYYDRSGSQTVKELIDRIRKGKRY